jgi:coenzyme PQQ synthesis protein D (PqqD)
MLDIKKGVFCKLNAAGSRVWLAIDSSPSGVVFEDVVTALGSQNANVHHERLKLDVSKYLDKLEQMELVHRRPDGE